jgi:hypothetical protein
MERLLTSAPPQSPQAADPRRLCPTSTAWSRDTADLKDAKALLDELT